jgi:hypothetical protein
MTKQNDISEFLDEDEFAIVVSDKGAFRGVFAPYEVEDFDQLPHGVLVILALIYGDQITNAPDDRTIH